MAMSKRNVFTTITPLPAFLTRDMALAALRDHVVMIDMNPLVIDRRRLPAAPEVSTSEELAAIWYEITDKITYMPGISNAITYHACFHDLPDGLQTHVHAPAGVEIRGRWRIGGSAEGEPAEAQELGMNNVPKEGLYLAETTDLKCNFLMASFVKKNIKKSHGQVVEKMIAKAKEGEEAKDSESEGTVTARRTRQDSTPRSPTYTTFASESDPDVSRSRRRATPEGYRHYQQDDATSSIPPYRSNQTSHQAQNSAMPEPMELPSHPAHVYRAELSG